jgi:hypothetical protein
VIYMLSDALSSNELNYSYIKNHNLLSYVSSYNCYFKVRQFITHKIKGKHSVLF